MVAYIWSYTNWFRPRALHFVGSHYDVGGTFYPGYNFPQSSIVPWRTDSKYNEKDSDRDGDDYYGTAGYILFATRFDFPNANPPDTGNSQLSAEGSARDPTGHSEFPNIVAVPEFVRDWKVLAPRMLGGFSYAIVDDPRSQHGPRLWTFDGEKYPDPKSGKVTGVVPFVKLGVLDGPYLPQDDPQRMNSSDRWSFTVGGYVPRSFRLGVITDGLDGSQIAPGEITLRRTGGKSIGTGQLNRNRFVDIHFFDIEYAHPGDEFVVSATPGSDGVGAGISGATFDVNSDL